MPELVTRKRYSSDLDDAEWALIEPLLPPLIAKGWGAPCLWHRRDVVDAIFYMLKTGRPWRDLPGDFPPWNTVWIDQGAREDNRKGKRLHPWPTN